MVSKKNLLKITALAVFLSAFAFGSAQASDLKYDNDKIQTCEGEYKATPMRNPACGVCTINFSGCKNNCSGKVDSPEFRSCYEQCKKAFDRCKESAGC